MVFTKEKNHLKACNMMPIGIINGHLKFIYKMQLNI